MPLERTARPLAHRLKHATPHLRAFSSTPTSRLETESITPSEPPPPPPPSTATKAPHQYDPALVSTPQTERHLLTTQRRTPIGSRRRRAALASTSQIPFSQLPYQCFQEARAYLLQDRQEKLKQITLFRHRIEALKQQVPAPQEEAFRDKRVADMRRKLEHVKVLADINDPIVKRKFEDGDADMTKPIYRHLSNLQWRTMKRPILMQRITQMHVLPDVLPALDPILSTTLLFHGTKQKFTHGALVSSLRSERPPRLTIQPYDKGTRLLTLAVVNADVPDVATDGFGYRCHFLASNIEVSPVDTRVDLGKLSEDTQVLQRWLPAYAQKGAPYQRMCLFVFEQPRGAEGGVDSATQTLPTEDIRKLAKYMDREGFNMRSFADRFGLKAVGVDLFRTVWDEGTAGVMQRAGVEGADVEFKRKRVEPLPYKRSKGERYR